MTLGIGDARVLSTRTARLSSATYWQTLVRGVLGRGTGDRARSLRTPRTASSDGVADDDQIEATDTAALGAPVWEVVLSEVIGLSEVTDLLRVGPGGCNIGINLLATVLVIDRRGSRHCKGRSVGAACARMWTGCGCGPAVDVPSRV